MPIILLPGEKCKKNFHFMQNHRENPAFSGFLSVILHGLIYNLSIFGLGEAHFSPLPNSRPRPFFSLPPA